jgi:hypothetical protein
MQRVYGMKACVLTREGLTVSAKDKIPGTTHKVMYGRIVRSQHNGRSSGRIFIFFFRLFQPSGACYVT